MNTKTTKFLAVLAALVMAFAVLAFVPAADAEDPAYAADLAEHADSDLAGLTVWYNDISNAADGTGTGLDMTVDGKKAYFVGTAYTPLKQTTYFSEKLTYGAYMGLEGFEFDSSVQKLVFVISDNMFKLVEHGDLEGTNAAYNAYGTGSIAEDKVTYTSGKFDASSMGTLLIPIPTDGSAVSVKIYEYSTSGDLLYDLVLDFSDAYTKIALGGASATQSNITGWTYTENTGGVLTLSDYCGNENFYLSNGTSNTVTISGKNTMGAYLVGGTEKSLVTIDGTDTPFGAIVATKALTIDDAGYTAATTSLEIDMIVEDYVTVNTGGKDDTAFGAIYCGKDTDINVDATVDIKIDNLKIVIDGDLSVLNTNDEQAMTVSGIKAGGKLTIEGDADYPVNLDVSVCIGSEGAAGIYSKGALSITDAAGKVEAGRWAIYASGSSATAEIKDSKLTLTGTESAIKTRGATGLTFDGADLTLNVREFDLTYDYGDNFVAGLYLRDGGLTVLNDSAVTTMGLFFSSIADDLTQTSGVITVKAGYIQNPDSKQQPAIAGLYTEKAYASALIYNGAPTGVDSYILLDGCDYYGSIKVLKADGTTAVELITDAPSLTTDALNTLKTKGVTDVNIYLSAAGLYASEIVIPETMTVRMNITVAQTGTTDPVITCGSQVVTFDADAVIGQIVITKDGITIMNTTALTLTDVKGNVYIAGEIKTADSSITGKEAMNLTFLDGAKISAKLTINSSKATILVPEEATVTLGATLALNKNGSAASISTLTVKGVVKQSAEGAITLGANAGTMSVSGALVGNAATAAAFITLAKGTSVEVTGVAGYTEDVYSTGTVCIGNGTTNYIQAKNLTGFTVSMNAAGSKYYVQGTLTKFDSSLLATAAFKGMYSSDLIIGSGVTASLSGAANDLVADGKLTVKGTLNAVKDKPGYLVVGANANTELSVTGKMTGSFTLGETTLTIPTAANSNYLTGLKFATVVDDGAVMEASISAISTKKTITADDAYTISLTVASKTLTLKDLSMPAYTNIVVTAADTAAAFLTGTVSGPDGAKVTFDNAGAEGTAGTDDIIVAAGSLTVSGKIASDADSALTIQAGTVNTGALTVTGTLTVAKDATLELGGALDVTSLIMEDNSALIGIDDDNTVTAESGQIAKTAFTNAMVDDVTYADGATFLKTVGDVEYLMTVVTYSGTQYAVGAPVYTYAGKSIPIISTGATITPYAEKLSDGTALAATGKALKNVADAVGTTEAAASVTITSLSQTFTVPVQVGPATVKIIMWFADDDDAAVAVDTNAWDANGQDGWVVNSEDAESNPLSYYKVYEISDKTSTFGTLPFAYDNTYNVYFDKWQKKDTTGDYFYGTEVMYTYTNSLAITEIKFIPATISSAEKTWTVTFYNDSTVISTKTVTNGDRVAQPEDPVAPEGMKFAGWFTTSDCVSYFNFKSAISADTKVYAGFEDDSGDFADDVAIAVSKATGGVKVTIASLDDEALPIPSGKITVNYWYWVNVGGEPSIVKGTKTVGIDSGDIVHSETVKLDKTPVYVVVEFDSTNGVISEKTPTVMY